MNGTRVVSITTRLLSLYGTLEGASKALATTSYNDAAARKLVLATLDEIQAVWTNTKAKK